MEQVLAVGAMLGEGPIWHDAAVWFVDIKQKHVHRFDPATRAAQRWEMPGEVGWVWPAADGGMIAGLQTGIYRFDPATGATQLLHDPEPDLPGNRLNDATVDKHGRIWFGTMDNGERKPTGRFHLYAGGRSSDTGLPAVAITNGPAVSADARMLYPVDTLARTIWRVPINDDASLGKPEVHLTIEEGAGYPDGPVIDAEGCLWVGLYAGWAVRRYDPAGRLMTTIRFPVANITKMAFGGADLRTGYATTARQGLDAAALVAQPGAGDLFAFDPGVAGVKITAARI